MSHALVVGGTRGIGRVIADSLYENKYTVTTCGRNRPGGWLAQIVKIEKIKSLVFCQRYRGEGNTFTGEIVTSLMLTNAIIEQCIKNDFFSADGASIVIVSSVIAHTVANEQPVGYHMAKAALEGMMRYYAVTLGKRGVRVNCVAPAVTLKPENEAYYKDHPEKVELFQRITPSGRMGTAQGVANVVVWLCSPGAAQVTGQTIVCDGGVSLVNQEALARSFLPKESGK